MRPDESSVVRSQSFVIRHPFKDYGALYREDEDSSPGGSE